MPSWPISFRDKQTLNAVLAKILAIKKQADALSPKPQPPTPKGTFMSTSADPIQAFATAADAALTDIGNDLTAIAALITQLQQSPTLSPADQALLTQVQTQITDVQAKADALTPPPAAAPAAKTQ